MAHEHEHAHGHEHGHAHGHEHAHGHRHEHGHAHGHEHAHEHVHEETIVLAWAHVELEAHTHEQAATVSAGIHPNETSSTSFSDLVNCMQAIASSIEQAGGIVGHIKAFAKQEDAFARGSVTAANLPPSCDGDLALRLAPATEIQLVAIALLIDQATLISICKEALV